MSKVDLDRFNDFMVEYKEAIIAEYEKRLQKKDEEIERLNNIIKEVREYIMIELITDYDIKYSGNVSGSDLPVEAITPILEILDKVGVDKE